jgi:hypothetical protein
MEKKENKIEENKIINILGVNNKYQIKKVKKEFYISTKRIESNKWNLHEIFFTYEKQIEIIEQLKENVENTNIEENTIFKKQILKKISGYKNQDNIKKIFDNTKFIDIHTILQKMSECKLKCYFCNCEMLLIYELTREMKQWTVDRINNEVGHNNDNFIIACLECNLKRKNKNVDSFLFTKQLNIIKMN